MNKMKTKWKQNEQNKKMKKKKKKKINNKTYQKKRGKN